MRVKRRAGVWRLTRWHSSAPQYGMDAFMQALVSRVTRFFEFIQSVLLQMRNRRVSNFTHGKSIENIRSKLFQSRTNNSNPMLRFGKRTNMGGFLNESNSQKKFDSDEYKNVLRFG
jgi:hypothetical protein